MTTFIYSKKKGLLKRLCIQLGCKYDIKEDTENDRYLAVMRFESVSDMCKLDKLQNNSDISFE